MIIPVILSGGSGTRLWPLSTPERPKQFLPLVSDKTLFQETLLRLSGLQDLAEPIIVCNEGHRNLVADQLNQIGIRPAAVVLEPEGRNTAPAVGVAAFLAEALSATASESATSSPAGGPVLLVLPADHVIADAVAFRQAVATAVQAASDGRLVTFGVVPTHPETGYGYIERGDPADAGWWDVRRFVEKPDRATAETYLRAGRFFWNSGMFVFGAGAFLGELGRHAPAIRTQCETATASAVVDGGFTVLGPAFLESPADSIDYAVMERTRAAAVVPLDAGWSDVGSWAALFEALVHDASGNVLRGDAVTLDVRDSLVVSDVRRVALLGLDNVVVIDAGDTVLVMDMDRSQDVKELLRKSQSKSGQS